MRRLLLSAAAAAALGAGPGCRTTSPGWPTALPLPRSGPLAEAFPASVAEVAEAARAGLDDLGVEVDGPRPDAAGGAVSLVGRTPDRRPVALELRPDGAGTRAEVRADDPEVARVVLERIGVRLGTRPPAPAPELPQARRDGPRAWFSRSAVPDSVMLRDQAAAGYRDTPAP